MAKAKTTSNASYAPAPETKAQRVERVYKGTQEAHHDLFKLEVESMKKNTAWDGTVELVSVEHCHFFHTVNSDGKKQIYSSAIGGHFHKMELVEVEGGVPEVKCVSGPVKIAKRKNKMTGKWEKVLVPTSEYDNHTHDVKYINSSKVQIRKTNSEAAVVQAMVAQKTAPIPGVY